MLRQNADIAMYRVKNGGKGAAAFFDASMEREALARMKIEQSLRLAILEKRFCCAFQAKVDIRTKDVKGIEALVRLRDDEGVIQAPGTFINLAVELGLIDELTHLVLAEIVKSIDLINETFGADTTISINVAAKQAGNPEFMRPFAQALEETGFPKRFMIEVTEDAFVTKTHFQDEILPIFRKLGVGISIDDFGIGYSSLSALADITADEIKIDRSFITDIHKRPRSQGILRAIESLSEALGMTVIAEGIETYEELAYLQAATKIRYAQGYYFSRPIFLEELKPATPLASEARASLASRPAPESPPRLFARRQLSPLIAASRCDTANYWPARAYAANTAAIVLRQDRADQPAETLGLLVVQIAGQAERVAAGVDELLQRVGALRGIADHGDAGARTHLGDAGPQMRQQQIAVLAGELLHALVGLRFVVERLHLLLLPLGGVAHQLVGGLPGVLLVLAADHLQPHAEADLVLAAMRARHLP